MNKPALAEGSVLVAFGGITAAFANTLADHDVSVLIILAVALFTLNTGLHQGDAIGQALRTHLYRCPTKGCTVTIRAPKTLDHNTLGRYEQQATDHTLHTETEVSR
ncbi:hypothetical protein [Streptomyces sp. NPDC018584]|uniref:hypothetical protein n=1 Tax=unclassified Streptomyces TaxID=2593676 RepID=UPI0037A12759